MPRNQALESVKRQLDVGQEPDTRVELLIHSALDLVEGHCKREFSGEVPAKILRIVAVIVQRALDSADADTPVGLTQLSHGAGPFNQSLSFAPGSNDGGVWLTKADKLKLRGWRSGGAFTIKTW